MTLHSLKLRSSRTAAPGATRWRARATRPRQAGYTAVEVLMSLAVLAVGVVGIIATEKVTLAANVHAKNLAIATHIGQSWLGMLETDATLWGRNGSLTPTTWLEQGAGIATWFRPTYDTVVGFGPAFDAIGNPLLQQDEEDAKFCVDLRLATLTTNNNGGGLVRAEVRVIWLRDDGALGSAGIAAEHACSVEAVSVAAEAESRLFHFVFVSGGVRQAGG
jgi:prepilin-type N-terminal cleavage/methylation domain-containing protein